MTNVVKKDEVVVGTSGVAEKKADVAVTSRAALDKAQADREARAGKLADVANEAEAAARASK